MALSDVLFYHSVIPPSQTALLALDSAVQRMAIFVPLAALDELVFRLIMMSAAAFGECGGAASLVFLSADRRRCHRGLSRTASWLLGGPATHAADFARE